MSTHNIGFYEEISKIILYHQISSNKHLISSSDLSILHDDSNVSDQTGWMHKLHSWFFSGAAHQMLPKLQHGCIIFKQKHTILAM